MSSSSPELGERVPLRKSMLGSWSRKSLEMRWKMYFRKAFMGVSPEKRSIMLAANFHMK